MSEYLTAIFNTVTASYDIPTLLASTAVSLALGLLIAVSYRLRNRYSKSFIKTIALLPLVVSMIILLVNGNLGAGVAVAGAFSLVKFRSVQGTAREILALFIAMTTGISCGMGFYLYGTIFVLSTIAADLFIDFSKLGESKKGERLLKITIPEGLNYTDAFKDIFEKYLKAYNVLEIKTMGLGSMFKLTYEIELSEEGREKEFIDNLRCRNGNLEILLVQKTHLLNEL